MDEWEGVEGGGEGAGGVECMGFLLEILLRC